jgi:Ca2+-binding RTX toxin-like protein/type III secretion system FlhB-like substrate exporter
MASFYNTLGSTTVTGTTVKDRFLAFTKDDNLDHIRADATLASLVWNTAILLQGGAAYQLTAANIQISSDLLVGDLGTDIIYGSNLSDAIFYNNGVIAGGFGSFSSIEQIWLGNGDDIVDLSAHGVNGVELDKNIEVHGEGGNDRIIGGAGNDTLFGDGGDDILFGYRGADTLNGGGGNDILYGDDFGFNGFGSHDKLNGDAGNDQLYGGGGDDELSGGAGNDLLDGGTGNDYVAGGAGADTLLATAGNDTLDGGADFDTAVFTGNRGDYSYTHNADGSYTLTDLRSGSPDGTDTLRNIDFLTFSDQTITMGQINTDPTIISDGGGAAAALSMPENMSAVTTVGATDPDIGQALSYAIAGGADAALFTINASTGALSFINAPDFEDPADTDQNNVYQVIVSARDVDGGIDTQSLSITVQDVADAIAPVINSNGGGATAALSIAENGTAVTTVVATDADDPVVYYSITGGADAALFALDMATGVLTFKAAPDFENPADANHDGIYDVVVQASDGTLTDQQTLAVSVTNLNDNAPAITSNGGGASAQISVAENGTAVTMVGATDADGPTPTYSIAGGADAALFTLDPVTGQLAFQAAPDFENPTDSGANGIYDVIVQASDGTATVNQALAVSVTNANDAPIITSNGGGAAAAISIAENSTAVATVAATDQDGTAPSYSLAGGADAALFQINAVTGALSFISAPDFENPADANHDGVYDVIVQAGDGSLSDQQTLAVTVTNLNDNAPVIISNGGGATAGLSIAENGTAVTTVVATDADGPTPTYALNGGADAALFQINAVTGALSFKVAPDYESPTDSGANGIYDVIVRASDGTTTVDQALAVTVTNGNDIAPVIGSNGGGAAAAIIIAENSAAVTSVTATDGDGTTPTYTLAGGADAALFQIDAATGALSFKIAPDFENALDANANNIYEVIVRATDGLNFDDQALSISVTDLNEGGRTITGTTANNTINPTTTVIALQTTALNDTIYALAGNDIIDGGGGADYMDGGIGNDTFYVDTYSDDGFAGNDDQVIETVGGGIDVVNAATSYKLAAEVENLTLIGVAAINGTGNELVNTIIGNAAANILSGGLGNDILTGNAGADTLNGDGGDDVLNGGADNDVLFGGIGADKLDGGVGADVMDGGADNDLYTVDTWSDDGNSANDDIVIELAGGGTIDQVNAFVTYKLTDQVERLVLSGTAAIDGTGNALDNLLTGNAAANQLWGGLGNDTLNANAGDDRLFGEDGIDSLDGGAGNDYLDGGAASDTLLGKDGDDTLYGALGKDTLTGGLGADIFLFNFGDTTQISSSLDKITDFKSGEDRIDLGNVSGTLAAAAYAEGAIATNTYSEALTLANSMMGGGKIAAFIAGTTDGWLFWDGNGDGLIEQAVLLGGVNSLAGFASTDIF